MKLFKDKKQIFECAVKVDGDAKINTVRLILSSVGQNMAYMFNGLVDDKNKCRIEIPPLKECAFNNGDVILEVIADNTVFKPWGEKFYITESVKVETIPIVEEKPKTKVIVENVKKGDSKTKKVSYALIMKEAINLYKNLDGDNRKKLREVISTFTPNRKLSQIARKNKKIVGKPNSFGAKLFMFSLDNLKTKL